MEMSPERSNPLHNFDLPHRLRWGSQRHLRCKKLHDQRSDLGRRSDGIEAIGERLMMDFKLKIDSMNVVGGRNEETEEIAAVVVEGGEESSPSQPWNLRVRKSPPSEGVGVVVVERRKKKKVSEVEAEKVVKKLRVRLERDEIEKDFVAMGGIKLPRRPKKRPRAIQKELDNLFPGLGLTEVNLEKYAVREVPQS